MGDETGLAYGEDKRPGNSPKRAVFSWFEWAVMQLLFDELEQQRSSGFQTSWSLGAMQPRRFDATLARACHGSYPLSGYNHRGCSADSAVPIPVSNRACDLC